MSEPSKAVFLSYASQDAEAAKRICDALRGAGVEVWFDAEGGLEHGDEWDAKIRKQIKDCVLFIPVISASTEAREEGYFRIEWELAAQRALGIATGVAFILPVVIDGTREPEALVPDRFLAVQWTRLPGGAMPPEVLQRFLRLWSHRTGMLKAAARPAAEPERPGPGPSEAPTRSSRGKLFTVLAAVFVVAAAFVTRWSKKPATAEPASAAPAPQVSEVRQLTERARALFVERLDTTRDDCALAEDLLKQAQARDGNDAEVWAALSQLHSYMRVRGWDISNERREAARAAAQRAGRLDPRSFEGRLAEAFLLADTGPEAPQKERVLRELRREQPTNKRVMRALASVLDRRGELAEADALSDEAAALPGGDPLALYNKSLRHWFAGNTTRAEPAVAAALAQEPNFTGALMISAWYATILHGDLDRARATLHRIPAVEMREDRAAYFAYFIELLAREPDAAIARLQAVPRPWFNDGWYRGTKAALVGDALHAGGRPAAAAVEWRAALLLVDEALREAPNSQAHLFQRALLLAKLGERAEAEKLLGVLLERLGANNATETTLPAWIAELLIAVGRHDEAITQISRGLRRDRRAVDYTAATLRLEPKFDGIRSDPRFAQLIAEAEAIERSAAESANLNKGAGIAAPPTEGAQLAARALAMYERVGFTREDLEAAADLTRRATEKEPDSAHAWGVRAGVQAAWISRNWDRSEKRRQDTQNFANRALVLDPREPEALLSLGQVLRAQGATEQAVAHLRQAVAIHPGHVRLGRALGFTLLGREQAEDARVVYQELVRRAPRDPLIRYELAMTFADFSSRGANPASVDQAVAELDAALAIQPFASALLLKAAVLGGWRGDLPGMRAALDRIEALPLAERTDDRTISLMMWAGLLERRPERVEAAAALTARNYIEDRVMPMHPKSWSLAQAHRIAGKDNLALADWAAAAAVIRQRLQADPGNLELKAELAVTLGWMGRDDEARLLLGEVEPPWREQPGYGRRRLLAFAHAALGDAAGAAPYLRALLDTSLFFSRSVVARDPMWDKLRGQPEFEAVLAEPRPNK